MRSSKNADQLVAPAAPAWPDDESRQTVIQSNQAACQHHMGLARQRADAAKEISAEVEVLSRDVAEAKRMLDELQHRYDNRLHDQRAEEHYAQQEWKAAQAFAVACASLGAPVPQPAPLNGELSSAPDAALSRFNNAHDAYAEGGS